MGKAQFAATSDRVVRGPLLTNAETARMLGVSTHYLDNLRHRRQGPPFIRLSKRRVAYDSRVLDQWLLERTVGGEK